jgi:hypothetical protein
MANPCDVWFAPLDTFNGKSMMEALYDRLDGAYPHKWRSNFASQEAIDNWMVSWAEAFADEGIQPSDIKAGLKACRSKYEWPPSCAEFIKACKPSVDSMTAYYQALAGIEARKRGEEGQWSHPAVYWAAMPLAFDLGSQTFSQMKGRWEQALAEQMGRGEWPAIPKAMVAIAAPGKSLLSRENATAMVAELGLKLQKTNHTVWYENILERVKRGDKTLSMVQINFAKEAARNHGVKEFL